jgi:hypothetical protein
MRGAQYPMDCALCCAKLSGPELMAAAGCVTCVEGVEEGATKTSAPDGMQGTRAAAGEATPSRSCGGGLAATLGGGGSLQPALDGLLSGLLTPA